MVKKRIKITPLPVLIGIALILFVTILILQKPEQPAEIQQETVAATVVPTLPDDPEEKLAAFAQMNGLTVDAWPEYMVELLQKNPDAEEYVLNYPLKKNTYEEADLSYLLGTGKVPQLYQWDARWGYTGYGDKEMGLTGCGPTCLSMVCLYYLDDAKFTPRYVANIAQYYGYYTMGVGTEWSMMSEGAEKLGLNVTTIPPNADRIMANLEAGNLVILSMGPGIFTEFGHYILLAGVEDGLAVIHDPNSTTKTAQLWDVSSFQSEIENAWVYLPPEE